MSSKLTLSIQPDIIQKAKKYAKLQGRSLSNIVEEYLKSISTSYEVNQEQELSKILQELKGSVKLPAHYKSSREALEDALLEKYIKE